MNSNYLHTETYQDRTISVKLARNEKSYIAFIDDMQLMDGYLAVAVDSIAEAVEAAKNAITDGTAPVQPEIHTETYEGIDITITTYSDRPQDIRLPWGKFGTLEAAKANIDMWRNAPMDSDNPLKATPAPMPRQPRRRLVVDEHHDEITEEIEILKDANVEGEIVEETQNIDDDESYF